MTDCPIKGKFELCEKHQGSEGNYVRVRPTASMSKITSGSSKGQRMKVQRNQGPQKAPSGTDSFAQSSEFKVEATRKTSPGVKLAFIARLKKLEQAGVPFSAVNEYLRAELGTGSTMNPLGLGYVVEMLTYDPRNDSPKSYTEAQEALAKIPSSMDWGSLYEIVEGMNFE